MTTQQQNTRDGESIDNHKAPNKNTAWISILILLIGLTLFLLISASSNLGEAPLINNAAKLYIDASNKNNIEKMMSLPENEWQSIKHSNFPISTNAHWFRAYLPLASSGESRVIEVSFSNLDYVDVWFISKETGVSTIMTHFASGDNYQFEKRPVLHDQFLFPVPTTSSELEIYIRVETQGTMKVPIKLWNENTYIQYIASTRVFIGIFYGFMAAMSLVNLFLFVTSRNGSTLLYASYIVCLMLTLASSQGISFRYLWPHSIGIQQHAVLFFASWMVFFSSSFTAKVLDLHNNYFLFSRVFNTARIIIIFYILVIFLLPYSVMISILGFVILMMMFLIFTSTAYFALKGNSVAKYLSAAWCSLLFSGLIGVGDSFGLINLNLDSSYLLMVGAIIQSLFMALSLAVSFNDQRLEVKKAYAKAKDNKQKAIEANEALLQLQIQTREELEFAVDERTYELEIAIRELNEANHELERKTSLDVLTGLANRRLYDKRIIAEARRSRREKTPLAIAMFDIDHFKAVNDTYGHHCGDEALKHFAKILKKYLKRPSDIVCRYGGEEFVVILPNTELSGAEVLMENIRKATEESELTCDGQTLKFTVSIGVSSRVIATDSDHELLSAFADKLLYKAKELGRNRVVSTQF